MNHSSLCEGRTVIITGAGRGLGRAYALAFARHGARVVVNDLGGLSDGTGSSSSPAEETASEIVRAGGEAIANHDDIASWTGAKALIDVAVERFGRVDVLVNNAGILRDRTLVNMTEDDWDSVIRVHLRGTFAPTHFAALHWRERHSSSEVVDARLINTASSSGLFANAGQGNYAAAKAGIASMTIVASKELAKYGVTANAIYPTAHSRLTDSLLKKRGLADDEGQLSAAAQHLDPANVAPFVVWLGSSQSAAVTGRVFGIRGDRLTVAEGWAAGPTATTDAEWSAETFGPIVEQLLADARPNASADGLVPKGTAAVAAVGAG